MPAGRPPFYSTPEEMEVAIEQFWTEYEAECEERWDRDVEPLPPRHAQAALSLGFESRQSLWDYGKKENFSYTINRLRLRIEDYWEGRLALPGCTGAIFWNKNNAGYKDAREEKIEGGVSLMWKDEVEEEADGQS